MPDGDVVVHLDGINNILGGLETVGKVVRATAFRIEGRAKKAAPVDTGFLRASIYTVTNSGDGPTGGMSDAVQAAGARAGIRAAQSERKRQSKAKNSRQVSQAASSAARDAAQAGAAGRFNESNVAPSASEAYVIVGANYGPYIEFGTRRKAARPFLRPAAEAERIAFETTLKRLIEKGGKS